MKQEISQEDLMLLDQYLNAELDEDAMQLFRKKQLEDPEWENKLNTLALLRTGIAEVGLKEEMKQWHQTNFEEKATVSKPLMAWWKIAAIAASLILAFGVWFLFNPQDSSSKLYAAYYKPDPGLMTLMSSTDDYVFEKAMVEYKSGHYKIALQDWQKLASTNANNDTLQYFIAACWQAMEQYSEAKPILERLSNATDNGPFKQESIWYLALIQVKEKDYENAKKYLSKSTLPKAQALLQKLSK